MLTQAQTDLGLSLLAAHALADFVFQPDWMVKAKNRTPVLLLHSLIAAAFAYVAGGRWGLWLLPALVFLSHAAIDHLKARVARGSLKVFLLDQAAHIAVVVFLAWVFTKQGELTFWGNRFGVLAWRFWILATGLVLCVRVGGILIGFWVKPYLDEIERSSIGAGEGAKVRGLTSGGRVIGQLERLLIFMLIGMGQLAGVGFLVAAKSIFRFGELKDRENRMEAEYITIGTLISFSWAFATSVLVWWLARL